jgi:hypothetical protein
MSYAKTIQPVAREDFINATEQRDGNLSVLCLLSPVL